MSEQWYAYLDQLSRQYGTGDVSTDLMAIVLVLSFLALVVGLVFYRREQPLDDLIPGLERLQSMNGKLEKIERTLNEVRSEALRNSEFAKGSNQYIRTELGEIRDSLDFLLQRKGGSRTPSSGGGSGAGGDGGGSGSSGSGGGASGSNTGGVSASPIASYARETEDVSAQEVKSLLSSVVESAPAVPVDLPAVEERSSIFGRLQRSRDTLLSRIKGFFSGKATFDSSMVDQLEEMLISGDIGVKTTMAIIDDLQAQLSKGQSISQEELMQMLREHLASVLRAQSGASEVIPVPQEDGPFVVVLVGVNGAGKTTTVAKLAHQWRETGRTVMVAAADTFRAAAVEQLKTWADRVQVPVISGAEGAKPATVVYDAMVAAKREKIDVLIIDTAGRLQNKSNLMQELEGIRNVMSKHQASAPHEVLLVVDGSSGQNALVQAREFHQAVKLSGVVVTKLDGTPKGGIVVAIKSELGIPVRYVGVGEKREDLKVFDADEFAEALISTPDESSSSNSLAASFTSPDARIH